MKNTFAPPKYKKIAKSGLALLFGLSMILSACIPEPENPTIQLSETSQLAQVRDWFEANKTKLRLPDRGTNYRTESQELILPFFEKEPDWEQFHHYYFPDGREVFEVSLENENLYIPKAKDAGASEEDVDYFQNILFVKHPTLPKFDPLIIRYYPDENSSNREFTEISYEMIDEKWSGWIDLFTYDEHYLMGYRITEGELTHTREMQKNPENARKIAVSSENKSDEAIHCYVVATDWYDGRTGEYLDTTHAQTCEWQRGGSRSSSGGYSEGSYGGGGGTDGLGGTCSSCYDPPEVPEPNLTVKITLSIKANPRMNCITNKMSLNSFVKEIAKFTETEQDPANTTLKLGPLSGANGQMQPDGKGNYEITINSSQDGLNRPDLLIAKTILHELVHAEIQEALRKKGVTAWDNDFGRNFDTYVKLYKGNNDQHHSYMAEQLLGKMGAALMDIHKNQFPEDFAKLTAYMKSMGDYPKGIPVDFYMNICWQGLKETTAFSVMKKITTNPPILSPYEKYVRDISDAKKLTKPCGS